MVRGFKKLAVIAALIGSALPITPASAEPRVYLTSRMKFVADGKEIECSWWYDRCEFGSYFDESAEAKSEYLKYQDVAQWTPYLRWGAVGLFLVDSIINLSSDRSYDAGTALAVFIVPWIAANIVSRRAARHLLRAVNLMNGVPPEQALLSKPVRFTDDVSRAPIFAYSF